VVLPAIDLLPASSIAMTVMSLSQVDNSTVFIVCPIGAALAAGSVAVAKRAERDDGAI